MVTPARVLHRRQRCCGAIIPFALAALASASAPAISPIDVEFDLTAPLPIRKRESPAAISTAGNFDYVDVLSERWNGEVGREYTEEDGVNEETRRMRRALRDEDFALKFNALVEREDVHHDRAEGMSVPVHYGGNHPFEILERRRQRERWRDRERRDLTEEEQTWTDADFFGGYGDALRGAPPTPPP